MADKTTTTTTKAEVHAHPLAQHVHQTFQAHRIKPDAEVTEADDSSGGELSPGREPIDPSQKNCRPAARGQGGHTVSRPPSSHLTPVDEEEPSSATPGALEGRRSSRAKSVETVDRGVGPTPAPQPPPSGSGSSLPETRLPTYLSFQPFGVGSDPRTNGLLDAAAYAAGTLPYPYGAYGCPVNTPLPLNPSTLEGRYHWPPVSFPPSLHGLSASPTPSDVSLLSMRSHMLPREPVTQLASRIHLEQLQRNYYSPLSSRRISSSGLPFPGASPFIGDYPPAAPSLSGRSLFSDVPPTPGSGSITLPGSLESSRLNSPRASVVGGKSRKRTLSHSPISDILDIQSLTRSSEGSLQLASFLQHNSRSSSAASGSYGHLSAASFGTASPAHPLLPTNPYYRQNPMVPPNFLYAHPHFHPMLGRQGGHPGSLPGQMLPPSMQGPLPMGGHKGVDVQMGGSNREQHISTTSKEAGSSSIVSSTMDGGTEARKAKVKKEQENIHRVIHPDEEEEMYSERGEHVPQEGEPDFLETNCHWIDCHCEFESQDELVKHINQDHIQSNKKSFVCRWAECSREEKPFKAQYMLVVHMRRHTGEKPHRCTFEGCNKAYSRLENLKTHLRSHTGEKPYMCEFPGCTKAFSNASDRAKHQNRTHSNAKPYVCKALGCTKRYTDPSSLRKHVKTVHGPDFYANKKHKGDSMCHVKKEDPDGDHDSCDVGNHQMDDKMGISSYSGPPSGDNRNSQDNIGSAPSSNSQLSPESSPEVIVTCGLDQGQGQLIDDQVNSGSGGGRGRGGSFGMEEEDVIVPEPNEADCVGTGALLTRRNAINTGHIIQNRLKDRMHTKGGLLSPLPHLPSIHSPVSQPPIGESSIGGDPCQISITELSQKKGGKSQGSPLHKRISDLAGKEPNTWRDNGNTLLPASRRESNTSSLSSYMSSMRSDTFSSRRSSGFSQFSSRRSSGASRLSIANSPYEYDITGNLPNPVSRRSSGESSTNIGNVSAMMQKANLGSRSSAGSIGSTGALVVANPPAAVHSGGPSSSAVPHGGGMNNASMATCAVAAGAAAASGGGCGSGCAAAVAANGGSGAGGSGGVSAGGCGGNGSGNRYYNDRLARYFSTRKDSDGMRTETPCMTPLPHEIPNREVRRASDPVKSKTESSATDDMMGKSLQRCRSLNMVKPLPTPTSMKSLKNKSGSVNTFKSSHSSIATDISLPENGGNNKDRSNRPYTDAELEEKMLEDSEDVIIPDDMRRFLNETVNHQISNNNNTPGLVEDGADGILESLEVPQDVNYEDNRFASAGPSPGLSPPVNNNGCNNLAVMNANMNTPHHHPLQVGNLQVQTGFADLRGVGVGVVSGVSPSQPMDALQQPSPHQRHNFSGNNGENVERKGSYHSVGKDSDVSPCVKIENCGSDQQNKDSNMSCCRHNDNNLTSPPSNINNQSPQNGMENLCNGVNRQCQGHDNNNAGRGGMTGHHMTGCGPSSNLQHRPRQQQTANYPNFNNNNNMTVPCGADLGPPQQLQQPHFPPSPSPHHPHPQWGTNAGSGPVPAAYLSQHNLMQHQLQQHYHPQQNHPHHPLQQQQNMPMPPPPPPPHHHHPNLPVDRPMSQSSSSAMQVQIQPHPPTSYPNPYAGGVGMPSIAPGGFSPMPPPGEKPVSSRPHHHHHHHKQCASPQVQVPHISQSQIPANAKAATRNVNMAMKQQTSQLSLQMTGTNNTQQPLPSPLPLHPHNALMSPNNNQPHPHPHPTPPSCHMPHPPLQLQQPQHNPYPQYGPYPPPPHHHPHPLHPSNHPPQSPHLFNPNIPSLPNAYNNNNNPQNLYLNPQQPSIHHPPCHPSPHQPQSSPSSYPNNNNQQQPSYHPMEMSPGCNQVTSSTDCKETTAPPIEDFMDNLTSISTENLMENITSISQENIVYSPTPASMRTASQNSGRFNSLMNTSNMVVNDMSSVLTQLAEENKYLSMRP